MNTDPTAIKILCYGDSNTWGQKPDKSGRYAADVRWTGRLQQLLGDAYYLVEEGLSSRTTDLDYAQKPGRNGKTYLLPCLYTHNPIDIVILMLGTNDLKIEYGRTAVDIAQAIEGLVQDVTEHAKNKYGAIPKIVLVSPILINDKAPRFAEFYTGFYNEQSARESQLLADAIAAVAQKTGCAFADAARVAEPGEDGIHSTEASQIPLAELLKTTLNGLE
jgi:lysophospholipase L1-like esterase